MKAFLLSGKAIVLGFVLGLICAFFRLPGTEALASGIAFAFMSALKLISIPLIFLAIVSTLASLESFGKAARMIRILFSFTLLTTLLAATVALILFITINPVTAFPREQLATFSAPPGSYLSFLKEAIPDNIIAPLIEGNVIGVALIATLISAAILSLPQEQAEPLRHFFSSLFQAMLTIARWIIALIPIATFAFTVEFIASLRDNTASLTPILLYAACVVGANLIQGIIVLPLILKQQGIAPSRLARAMSPALMVAFFAKSSNAALPVTLKCADEKAGISKKTAGISLPLCSVINMNGCAAFILITVLFVSMSSGLALSVWQMVPWIFFATFAAIGNAGVPMGCFFLTTAFLTSMNIPLELLGVILPLYTVFDMIETSLNVWSDSCVTAITDKRLH